MNRNRKLVLEWGVAGFLFGLLFPTGALVATGVTEGWASVYLHWETPALWVINLAPFISMLVTMVIGGAHAKLSELQEQTAALAERVAHEWTEEIHDSNVATASAAATRAKFFAALSHDMRTPLTAIMGFAQVAQMDEEMDAAALRGLIGEIGEWGGQLLEIVNDLQDATKLEAGAIEIQIEDIDANEIAGSAVDHMRALAEEKHLDLSLELHAEALVRADPNRFRQIIINLVSNALKYTDEGWVKVRSFVIGDHVVFEVQDSGAGISPEDMPKVFTAFEQTEVARGRTDSTGLGMAISLGMAEAMGGTISATSIGTGHGSTFRLVLERGTGTAPEFRMASLAGIAA